MDYYSMTDKGIAAEIGERIRTLRLRKNLTQQQLADHVMLSLNSIKALEKGKGKMMTLITVLRELGALDSLDAFVPLPQISPLQLVKLKGKNRERATGKRGSQRSEGTSEW
ncbi:MAG: helix-turn-helix domain-containing protein [Proteobacteria bacterium]|nr:helix-turn-helix domain-containing protein [Pseudomonadota bacterium]